MKYIYFFILAFVFSSLLYGQTGNVGVGTNNPAAKLDVSATDKGILIPRITLTGTDDITTVPGPDESELIYNTATAGSGATAVTPGFYFWDGSEWVRIKVGTEGEDHDWYESGGTAPDDINDDIYTLGNVGLGTTNPNDRLDLGDSGGDIRLYDAGEVVHILGDQNSGESYGIVLRTLNNPPSGEPIFVVESSGNSQRLRVEHDGFLSTSNDLAVDGTGDSYISGNLGVGTSSPADKLEVSGNARITGLGGNGNAIVTVDNNGTLQVESLSGTATEVFTHDGNWVDIATLSDDDWERDAGNGYLYPSTLGDFVGIGTATPTDPLHVVGNARITNKVSVNTTTTDGVINAAGGNDLPGLWLTGEDNIWFDDGQIRITTHDGYGNWQIKTGADNDDVKIGNDDGAIKLRMDEDGLFQIYTAGGLTNGQSISWNIGLVVDENGKVGIGTTNPGKSLHVVGDARVSGLASGGNNALVTSNSSGDLSVTDFTGSATDVLVGDGNWMDIATLSDDDWERDDGNGYLYLSNSNDNVGIGINDPEERLEVVGNINKVSSGGLIETAVEPRIPIPSVKKSSEVSFAGSSSSFPNLVGESDPCSGLVDFDDAVAYAEAQGGRLPTIEEVEADVMAGTGCGYDNEYIWTQTKCGLNKYYVTPGKSGNLSSMPRKCEDASAQYYVRFVAEVDKGYLPAITDKDGAIRPDVVKARSSDGITLSDEDDNLGVFIEDGGKVGIANSNPEATLHVSGSIIAGGRSTSPKTAINTSYEGIRMPGSTSDYIQSVQDGNGRIQHKWNATSGTDETYMVSGEPAWFWDLSITSDPYMEFKYAPNGTAGNAISWETHLSIEQDGNVNIPNGWLSVGGTSSSTTRYGVFETTWDGYISFDYDGYRYYNIGTFDIPSSIPSTVTVTKFMWEVDGYHQDGNENHGVWLKLGSGTGGTWYGYFENNENGFDDIDWHYVTSGLSQSVSDGTVIQMRLQDDCCNGDNIAVFNVHIKVYYQYTQALQEGDIAAGGRIYANSNSDVGDLAEYFPVQESYEKGDIISFSLEGDNDYVKSTRPYDNLIAGVVSENPSVVLNNPDVGVPIALAGRVRVNVRKGQPLIKRGEFLTSSEIPGKAQKATRAGSVIGYAVEDQKEGETSVQILLQPGRYYQPVEQNKEYKKPGRTVNDMEK